jgi:hypothetical protein
MPHDGRDFMTPIQGFLQERRADKSRRADHRDLHLTLLRLGGMFFNAHVSPVNIDRRTDFVQES